MSQITTAFNPIIWPIIPTQFDEDVGTAVPAANILNVIGGTSVGGVATNINTIGSGNTIEICLNNSISQPNTNALGTEGMYSLGTNRFMHNFGTGNTFLGQEAGNLTLTANAQGNTAIGYRAGQSLDGTLPADGDGNVMVGVQSGQLLTDGRINTLVGGGAGAVLLTGENNICLGFDSGSALVAAESGNILINNVGVAAESDAIRIGTSQTTNYQAGIYQVIPAGSLEVVTINSSGQLGSTNLIMDGWIDVTGTTQTIVVNEQYVADNAGLVTFTLPATASFGDEFWVVGGEAGGGWTIAQNANQAVKIGSSTSTIGVGGSISSTASTDGVRFLCTVAGASTRWTAITSMGTLAIV